MAKEYDEKTLKKLHSVELEILEVIANICDKNNIRYSTAFGTVLGAIRHQGFIPWDDDVDLIMPREDYDRFIEIVKKENNTKYKLLIPDENHDYISVVTKFEKVGTSFIPEIEKQMKCNRGIAVDIFPLENVANNLDERERQFKNAWFWGRIMFLRGVAIPAIPYKGLKKKLAEIICWLAHYFLVIFHIKQQFICRKYRQATTRYNNISTREVTSFEDANLRDYVMSLDKIFPCKRVDFEDIKINVPNDYDYYLKKIYGDYMQLPPVKERKNHYPYILDFGEK
ncbi:MAG: LicD family protein [Bacilli bacterium]